MKIFTKSMLTFLLLCVAGVVNAQDERVWQKVAISGYEYEWRDNESRYQGEADMEGDAYKTFVRSSETASAAGNMTTDNDGNFADWDSQFFITWGIDKALKEGDKIRLTMEVKADVAVSGVAAQAHQAPGTYNHYQATGNVDFTEEWTKFESGDVSVSADMSKGDGFYSIAFNLAKGDENTYYFRNIVVEIFASKKTARTAVSTAFAWTDLVINGDIESDDVTSFYTRTYPYVDGEPSPHSELVDGVGVDGSRGIRIETKDKVEAAWDTQFWIRLNEDIPAGATLSVNFDYRADMDAKTTTQIHTSKPGENSYIYYTGIGDVNFTTEWQHFGNDNFVVTSDQSTAEKVMGSIAFNMNENVDENGEATGPANVYYLDNISVKKGVLINDVRHNEEAVQVLFTDFTNMPDLLVAQVGSKSRVELPEALFGNFKVTAGGKELPIGSVEYDKGGQLYIFIDDDVPEEGVEVSFTNPADEAYRLIYTNGDKKDQAVEDFVLASSYDEELEAVPFAFGVPDIEASDPEDKSFNLEASISQFVITFDKAVKGGKIAAKLDGSEKLNVEFSEETPDIITLKRTGSGNLADGQHTISISTVYAATDFEEIQAASFTLTFSVGAKVMNEDLQFAIDKAKDEKEQSENERYAGDAFTALSEAITKYEAEGADYTAPSQLQAAIDDLSKKTQAMLTHRENCTTFDETIITAEDLVANYGNSKYASHELYKALAEAVGKYAGKVITDDTELKAAVADLKDNTAAGQNMFTEGPSNLGDSGIKVLVERIRLGAETLKELGVAEDDELIVAADNAMSDDDALANLIKARLTTEVYEGMQNPDDMFAEIGVSEEGDVISATYNMSAFIKNPNVYALQQSAGVQEGVENVPGWTATPGLGLYCRAWGGGDRNIPGLPEDCAFSNWCAAQRMEQTITDLPAGIYTVVLHAEDWLDAVAEDRDDSFAFVKLSTTLEPGEDASDVDERDLYFEQTMTFAHAGSVQGVPLELTNIEVRDGKLTLGVQFQRGSGNTQHMFDKAELYLTGALSDFNYKEAYEQAASSVNTAKTAQVRAIELYDLNGRRITKAQKGLAIVKRVMSDGSIETSKVVK